MLAKSKKPQHNDATQTLFPSKQHVKDPTKIQNTNTRSYTELTTQHSQTFGNLTAEATNS
jgi:hypothetical protein